MLGEESFQANDYSDTENQTQNGEQKCTRKRTKVQKLSLNTNEMALLEQKHTKS